MHATALRPGKHNPEMLDLLYVLAKPGGCVWMIYA